MTAHDTLPTQRCRFDWRKPAAVAGAGTTALIILLAFAMTRQSLVGRLGDMIFDEYQRLAPRPSAHAPVTVVDVDEASIAGIGQWPWPRTVVARMVDRLGQLGAAAIAFDIVFSEADRTSPSHMISSLQAEGALIDLPDGIVLDNDAALASAFSRNPVVAGIVISGETNGVLPPPKAGFAFGGDNPADYLSNFPGGVSNLPGLTQSASAMGFFSFSTSADGIIRQLPVLQQARGNLYPSLAVAALRLAQGAGSYIVLSTGASGEADTGHTAMTAFRVGVFTMPTGPDGSFRIYYSGLPDMPVIAAADLLDAKKSAEFAGSIAGHIVLIGTSAVGLRDLVATPLSPSVPGMRVHAELIDQIIGQTFLARPDWAWGMEIAGTLLCGLIVVALLATSGILISSIATAFVIVVWFAISWWAFSAHQFLFNPLLPTGAATLVFAVATPVLLLWTDRERRFIRNAFGRYLSPVMVDRLADDPASLKLGGENRDITVFFCDIRGFTTLSEGRGPEELTTLLNDYLTPATDVLLRSQATIDKYIGDAIMAFWNAPLTVEEHEREACIAALLMLDAVEVLNRSSGEAIRIGIGLNSGDCCVGNLGSSQRFSYSAIGDNVNLASRIEGLTKYYGVSILVSGSTRARAPDLALLEADLVQVVGRREAVSVHALVGDANHARSREFQSLSSLHAELIRSFRSGHIELAEQALSKLRNAAPPHLAHLYAIYADRLTAMRAHPPPADWDGVFVAEQK